MLHVSCLYEQLTGEHVPDLCVCCTGVQGQFPVHGSLIEACSIIKRSHLIFFFFFSCHIFYEIMRRGNVHCEQRSLQQVSLATLCGACLPSQWCMHQFMVQLCLYQHRGDRGAVPEDIMRAGGCPGAALCTTAFSEECVLLGNTPSSGIGDGEHGAAGILLSACICP